MSAIFHGSNTHITNGFLEPRVSFDFKPLVYATTDYAYALVRCGEFDPQDFAIKEEYDGHIITLVELRENAFNDIFETDGWIYKVDENDFEKSGLEYISGNSVRILGEHHVANVMNAMLQFNALFKRFKFVHFWDCDKYFTENGIDKASYMERRKQRAEKLEVAIPHERQGC